MDAKLRAALQRYVRAHKALEAITQCPARHPAWGVRCGYLEDHTVMVGSPHRSRRVHGETRPRTVEWVEW